MGQGVQLSYVYDNGPTMTLNSILTMTYYGTTNVTTLGITTSGKANNSVKSKNNLTCAAAYKL